MKGVKKEMPPQIFMIPPNKIVLSTIIISAEAFETPIFSHIAFYQVFYQIRPKKFCEDHLPVDLLPFRRYQCQKCYTMVIELFAHNIIFNWLIFI